MKSDPIIDRIVLKWPRGSIISVYVLVTFLILVPFYYLTPMLLSYAPGLIKSPSLYAEIYGHSFEFFYWSSIVTAISVHVIPLYFFLGNIHEWKNLTSVQTPSAETVRKITSIRKKCGNIPYYTLIAEITLPVFAASIVALYVFFTKSFNIYLLINVIKLILLNFSLLSTVGIVSFIFSKKICRIILLNTDIDGSRPGIRVTYRYSLAIQMILMLIVGIMVTSLTGYSKLTEEKGDLLFSIYKHKLREMFSDTAVYRVDSLKNILGTIDPEDTACAAFYYGENGDEYSTDHIPLHNDFTVYLRHLSDKYNGKVHMLTGELQGASIRIATDKGRYWVGIKYLVVSKKLALFFILSFLALLLFNNGIFFYFSHSLSNDISLITDNFNQIARNETINLEKHIPVVSNDEIGDLAVAFNNIQKMTGRYIEHVKKNETIIREQERLVSLGQMIGGIAHNIRSPLMSLSGGLEVLEELTTEYDRSIDNKQVTPTDHHAIANEMHEWIKRIQPYCSYIGDVISTVKDQSVVTDSLVDDSFTVDDLVKRVKIISRDAMHRKKCTVTYTINTDPQTTIHGNVTILVQVVNNLIENAFDAYTRDGGTVEVTINNSEEAIQLSVKDSGEGIPDTIKDRLFREMITTKGKNGTGLGLYISQSRIISSFQGTLTCETAIGKGTTMTVEIPFQKIRNEDIVIDDSGIQHPTISNQ